MIPNLRILTLTSYGDTEEENFTVTLSAMGIKAVFSKPTVIQDRPANDVVVLFYDDSEEVCLQLNDLDLNQLQSVVGTYGLMEG